MLQSVFSRLSSSSRSIILTKTFYKEQKAIQKMYAHKMHTMSIKTSVSQASQVFTTES